MRKYSLVLALAGSVVAVSGVSAQALPAANPPGNGRGPIAYVRSQLLFQEAPGAAEARTTIQREADKYQAELALAEDSIKNMLTDYQARSVMLSPDAKKSAEDAINAKKALLDKRAEQYERRSASASRIWFSRSWKTSTRSWTTCARKWAFPSSSTRRSR